MTLPLDEKPHAPQGLTPVDVLGSRAEHGENRLTPPERDPGWRLDWAKYDDPVIRILVVGAIASISG